MAVHLISQYLVALVGLAVGVAVGWTLIAVVRRRVPVERVGRWDGWATVPLLLGAAGAHLALIPQVETQRKLMFGLYVAALAGVVLVALAGAAIWRLGAILFPAGSIAAYFYYALPGHQADYVGLVVKLIELGAIIAAVAPLLRRERARGGYRIPT